MRNTLNVAVVCAMLAWVSPVAMAQQEDVWADWEMETQTPSPWSGFIEAAVSRRIDNDPVIDSRTTLEDLRLQLTWDKRLDASDISVTADLYYDGVKDNVEFQLREGYWQGSLSAFGTWGEHVDLKVGQQILTWGTGDYLFLNDLFAKDYQSFFSGRDDAYLKAPSLSARLSAFFDWVNLDVVVTPRFTPDTYINGDYFSFFNPASGNNIAPGFSVAGPNRPESPEWALRVYKSINGVDVALYGYRGFHKSPNSFDSLGRPRFTRLNVTGASAIWPAFDGLLKAEFALYNSLDDAAGDDPFTPNDQTRYLLGYERELITNLTGSVQWYLEHTQAYSSLLLASPWPGYEPEQNRQVITAQLNYRMLRDTLILNWFNFHSPTDDDGYSRLRLTYSPVDDWSLSSGINLFYGEAPHTFFSQFEHASNVFAAFRYYF